jgi:Flp pilus assembly protein TadD
VEHLQKAVALIPNNAEAQLSLGAALATAGRGTEALEHFTKAIVLKPKNSKAHYNLANLLASLGRVDESMEHYQRALDLDPKFNHARYQYALLLQSQGRFAEAAEEFNTILGFDPKHVPAMNNLAWLLAACPDNTVRDGKHAVELALQAEQLSRGKSPEILDTLACAYAEAGDFPSAIETVKSAMSLAAAQNKDTLAASMQVRLMDYQTDLPYRDTSLVSPAFSAKP